MKVSFEKHLETRTMRYSIVITEEELEDNPPPRLDKVITISYGNEGYLYPEHSQTVGATLARLALQAIRAEQQPIFIGD